MRSFICLIVSTFDAAVMSALTMRAALLLLVVFLVKSSMCAEMSTTSKPPTIVGKVVSPKDTEQQGAAPCDKCIICCKGCDGKSSESSSSESSEEKSAPESIQLLRRMVESAKLAELGKMSSTNQYKLVPVYDVVPYPSAFIQPFGRQSHPHPYAPAPNPVNVAYHPYHQPMQHLHPMRNY